MADSEKMVKVPEALFRDLERRAMKCTEIEQTLIASAEAIGRFHVVAVVTNPPSGNSAFTVLDAVVNLVNVAKSVGKK